MTALSVAWPLPVKASEPRSATSTEATRPSAPVAESPPANAAAAFIGPTVCDDDGPIPILKSSKTLNIARPRAAGDYHARLAAALNSRAERDLTEPPSWRSRPRRNDHHTAPSA